MSDSETIPITSARAVDPPPDYTRGDPENPPAPPSYQSVMERMKDAKKDSSGPLEFLGTVFIIIVGTIGFLIFVCVMLALPVAMITVGAINLYNCPLQHFIPIWLIVSGSVCGFMQLTFIGKTLKDKRDEKECDIANEDSSHKYGFFNCLFSLFNFAWFITGNVWVFESYAPVTDNPESPRYCQGGTYYFAFWLIIAVYIWIALACFCGLCFIGFVLASFAVDADGIQGRKEEDNIPANNP